MRNNSPPWDVGFRKHFAGVYNLALARNLTGSNLDISHGIAVDTKGNSYITSYFNGTTDFDPSSANASIATIGVFDIYIAKYDKDGNYVFAINMRGSGNGQGRGIEVDDKGDIYI